MRILILSLLLVAELWGQKDIFVDDLSAKSLLVEQVSGSIKIGSATGFVVQKGTDYFLITNWHVVTGRDPRNNEILNPSGLVPNMLVICHHRKTLGEWTTRIEPLLQKNGSPRWREHPRGKSIDVVALRLTVIDDQLQIYPFPLDLANADMVPVVAMPVSIIGFPGGFSGAGKFPIWKTGHIATDPDLDVDGLPMFLIDATTRKGMSGSPVVLRLSGGFKTRSGNTVMSQSGNTTLFLGIFSAQHPVLEIGQVWKPTVINEILPP